MSKLGDEEEGFLNVVPDLELGASNVCYGAQGDWTTVYDFEVSGGFQAVQGKVLATGKVLIHESKSCCSIINQSVRRNGLGGGVSKLARDNEVVSLQILLFYCFI